MWLLVTGAVAAPLDPLSGAPSGALDLPAGCTLFADSRPPEIRQTTGGALVATGAMEGGVAVFRFTSVVLDAPLLVSGSTPAAVLSSGDLSLASTITSRGPPGGFAGGTPSGPGAARAGSGAGGGFGGVGGTPYAGSGGGAAYGDLAILLEPGSGGAGSDNAVFGDVSGGRGGAALELGAAGRVLLTGSISLRGEDGQGTFLEQNGGGGSGGALIVHAGQAGSTCGAAVDVGGGTGWAGLGLPGGGGGGGRVHWVGMPATCATLTAAFGGSGGSGNAGNGVITSADPDRDGDGLGVNGGDCDDYDPARRPGAPDLCNGVDDDCDGVPDDQPPPYYPDADGDGAGDQTAVATTTCPPPPGAVPNADDCDDTEPEVFAGNPEACDALDNDCANGVDDGLPNSDWFLDGDHDGYGLGGAFRACAAPPDHAAASGDCDDADPQQHPGAPEQCNAEDDDCDGTADDGVAVVDWYADGDSDGYGDGPPTASCSAPPGTVATPGDCDDGDAAIRPGAAEGCDGVDEDCDGQADDGLPAPPWFPDGDGDGFGAGQGTPRCAGLPGESALGTDCNDVRADLHPGAAEACNGLDDDCDGFADEDLANLPWYVDGDGDGYGGGGPIVRCGPLAGEVPDGGDCDDADPDVSPAESESPCNTLDDDCEPNTPDFNDFDADGWDSCDDCDDADPDANPALLEARCNGVDDDCDPTTEDDPPDLDGDGLLACDGDCVEGDAAIPGVAEVPCNGLDDDCDPGTAEGQDDDADGAATCGGDCDDGDPTVYPQAPEACDGRDQDCDGAADEGVPVRDWFLDGDGDGVGGDTVVSACGGPDLVPFSGDCRDDDASIGPASLEIRCNGRDDDCDDATEDEPDDDHDGVSWCEDCDDADPTAALVGVEEACNGRDDDCDRGTPDAPDGDDDGLSVCDDCDDALPVGAEVPCNGVDEDCDDATEDRPDGDGDGASVCDDCDDDDPDRQADCGEDTGRPRDSAGPTDEPPDGVGAGLADRGCGCATGAPPGAVAGLAALVALGRRRRRAG